MTASVALLTYALLVAIAAPRALRRARWPERAPRAGIATWQALSASTLSAVVLAGLSAALPMLPFTVDMAKFLQTCAVLLQNQYATPAGAVATTAGLGLAALVTARLAWCGTRTAIAVAGGRRAQRRSLAVLAQRDPRTGILVLDHEQAAAYCLPGRGGRVVLTTGALDHLEADEVEAVIAHERAHLSGRHDVVVATSTALHAAFWFVPLFAAAAEQVPRLVEMAADDVAAQSADRASLAHALLRLANAPTPVGLLGAGGATAVARVRRLAGPREPLGWVRAIAVLVGATVALAVPLVMAAAPALSVASEAYCPVSVTV